MNTLQPWIVGLLLLALPAWCQEPPANFPWAAHDPDAYMLPGVKSSLYSQMYTVIPAGQRVRKTRYEKADASAVCYSEEAEFSVSYFFTCWTGREGGDVLYLCGMKSTGETVIECWTFPVSDGRWVVRCPEPTPAIGTPAPAYSTVVTVQGGGAWRWSNAKVLQQAPLTQPPPPQPAASPQITPLFEGNAGPFTAMDVDPEGRQLLLFDFQEKAVKRLRLNEPGATFETLYSAQAYPLLDQVASLEFRDFGSEGRKLLMRRQYGQTFVGAAEVYTIASDPDNDGNFDSITSLARPAFDASPYKNWAMWKEFWRLSE